MNVNVLDNKVGTRRLRRSLPLMCCYSQSEADKEEEEERIIPFCWAVFLCLKNGKRSDESEMQITTGYIFSPDLYCSAVLRIFNSWFKRIFSGQTVESLAKTSAQHHLPQYLMLHLILRPVSSVHSYPKINLLKHVFVIFHSPSAALLQR